jgi:hypothetical protein
MNVSVGPGSAFLRAGPLGPRPLLVRWPGGTSVAVTTHAGEHAVTGTLMVAEAHDRDPQRLQIADVIVAARKRDQGGLNDHGTPLGWLSETLREHPGCAVVAAWTGRSGCAVATRDGGLHAVLVRGRADIGIRVLGCAVFVHGWLAAGLPMALLDPARLEIAGAPVSMRPGAIEAQPPVLFFRFCYRVSPGIPDSSSRTNSASGAPSSS